MSRKIFCSLCGRDVPAVDSYICADCGLVICSFCLSDNTIKFGKSMKYKCRCGSEDILSFNELRTQLVEDLLNLRTKIRHTVYLPIKQNKRWIKLVDDIRMNLSPYVAFDFRDVDIELRERSLILAQRFIFTHLDDLSSNVKESYKRIIDNLSITDVAETNHLRFQMRYYEDHIRSFQSKVNELLEPLESDCNNLENRYKNLMIVSKKIRKNESGIRSLLEPMELVADVFENIAFKETGILWHSVTILVTLNRILVVRKGMLNRNYSVELSFNQDEIAEIENKNPKKLQIKLLSKEFQVKDMAETITRLKKVLKKFHIGKLSNYKPRGEISGQSKWKMSQYEDKLNQYLTLYDIANTEQNKLVEEKLGLGNYLKSELKSLFDKKQVIEDVLQDLRNQRNNINSVEYYRILETYKTKLQSINEKIERINGRQANKSQ